jgi:uncharacterized protein with HEPN domain
VRDDRERLLDMREAISEIEKYAIRGRKVFDADELVRHWIRSHLQTLGEAARGLSASFRSAHPEVSWRDIIGMRNILVHQYFEVDNDVVWSVVEDRLPELKRQVELMLQR